MSELGQWLREMQDVSATIDETFGEMVTLTPCAENRPNFPPVMFKGQDVTLLAVFSWRTIEKFPSGKAGGLIVEEREPMFAFSQDALPWAIQHHDRITRFCDGTMFDVVKTKPDGISRIVVHVNQLGKSHQ